MRPFLNDGVLQVVPQVPDGQPFDSRPTNRGLEVTVRAAPRATHTLTITVA